MENYEFQCSECGSKRWKKIRGFPGSYTMCGDLYEMKCMDCGHVEFIRDHEMGEEK